MKRTLVNEVNGEVQNVTNVDHRPYWCDRKKQRFMRQLRKHLSGTKL